MLNLAKYCNKNNLKLWILSFSDSYVQKKRDFETHVEGFLFLKESAWHIVSNLATLRRFLKSNEIDFAICNSAREVFFLWLSGIFLNVRLVVWIHGIPINKSHFSRPILRAASYFASAIVAVSEHLRSELITCGFSQSVMVIPNGVEVHKNVMVARKKNLQVFTFCMIGRYCAEKDHKTVILGFEKFIRQQTNPRSYRLLIIGRGDPHLFASYKSLVLQRGLHDFTSFAESNDPWETHGEAIDCVIVSSVVEGFSLVPVEAMSRGIPVIVSDIPVHLTLVEEDKYGMRFNTGDEGALCEKMSKMVEDAIYSYYSVSGMHRALDYDILQTCASLEQLLTTLVVEGGRMEN